MYIASYLFVAEIVRREALNVVSILGMCICMYVLVTLKNVNLQACLGLQSEGMFGMSICTHALIHVLHKDVG